MVSWFSRITGWNFMPQAARYPSTLPSCVVPWAMQTVAPFSSDTDLTPAPFFTTKPCPSWKLTGSAVRPMLVSRRQVSVELRSSTSISPDCGAVKRFATVIGTNLVIAGSPSAAAFPTIPVLKPNEAMIEEAVGHGGRIGFLTTFEGAFASMPAAFPPGAHLEPRHVAGALAALDRGDTVEHDRSATKAARQLEGCDTIALAQFSLARAAAAIAAATGRRALTTPESAAHKLRQRLS